MRPWPRLRLRRRRLVLLAFVAATAALVCAAPSLWTRYHLAAARAALTSRDSERALSHLRLSARFGAEHPERHFLLARTYRRLGRFDLVREHLEKAWRSGFDKERIRREEWLCQAQAGQLSQAAPHLARLLKDPRGDGPAICEAFVDGYFASYRFAEALPLLTAWQADYPDDPQPHVFLGLFYRHTSKFPQAAEAWRKALELAPHRLDVRARLGRVLVQMHEYAEAAHHFQVCLEAAPRDVDYLCGWGQCLLGLGRATEARQVFTDVLRLEPGHFEARALAGQLAANAGQAAEAVALLRPLSRERPTDPEVRYALAMALVANGEADEARDHFRFVAEARQHMQEVQNLTVQVHQQPNDSDLRYRIGTLLLKYDEPSHGAAWLRSVLNLNPAHRPAHAALAEYYRSVGNERSADEHLRLAGGTGESP